ncbi:hypothetical protein MHYMCMPASI_00125 [Hyalomma marginatum]|uniref:Uncharacterized protein n=1 Tax=Hyalomma marginatum TaxID=34627 RepID=A0A8S4C1K8_9ACAR|nr:hypothetical protein MHYMCMPASI_00125 [Hyalomma marginatum]
MSFASNNTFSNRSAKRTVVSFIKANSLINSLDLIVYFFKSTAALAEASFNAPKLLLVLMIASSNTLTKLAISFLLLFISVILLLRRQQNITVIPSKSITIISNK